MRGVALLSLLLLSPAILPAVAALAPQASEVGAANACPDIHQRFEGTATGTPDETVTRATDAIDHELTLGSEGCRVVSLDATMSSSDPDADFDLAVLFQGITVGTSTSPSSAETVELSEPPWGDYTFRVQPWLTVEADYQLDVHAELEKTLPAQGENRDVPTVVIAVVDTGINPYHEEFRADLYPGNTDDDPSNDLNLSEHPSRYIEGYPTQATALNLSLDAPDHATAVAQDNWSEVRQGQLYWIPGTKVVGAYDGGGGLDSGDNVLDEHGHGTASASVAVGNTVGACQRCLLVSVEGLGGLEWAMAQPWIDLVSNSWGNRGNAGVPTAGTGGVDAFGFFGTHRADHTRAAVERGQTVLFAAGNGMAGAFATPQTTYTSPFTGPDWVITVGATFKFGGQEHCDCPGDEGSILASGKPVDVSSYGAGDIPAAPHDSMDGEDQHSGTSAATPIVAGSMGQTLLATREVLGDATGGTREGVVAQGPATGSGLVDDGQLTREELERATKLSAQHTQSGWIGIYPVSAPTFFTPDDALWAEWTAEGWGVVSPRTAANATAMVLGDQPLADRPLDDQMAQRDSDARVALWGPGP